MCRMCVAQAHKCGTCVCVALACARVCVHDSTHTLGLDTNIPKNAEELIKFISVKHQGP